MDTAYKLATDTLVFISGDDKLKLFTIQRAFFNMLGYDWFEGGLNLPIPGFIKHMFYPIMYLVLMVVLSISTMWYVFTNEVNTQNDLIFATNGIICSMTFCASFFKSTTFFTRNSTYRELFLMVEELGALDPEKPEVKRHFYNNLAYITLVLANPLTWAMWFLVVHHDAPFKSYFPWNSDDLFWLSLFFDFLAGVFCAMTHVLIDSSFQMVVAGITLHVDKVAESLSHLGEDRSKDNAIMSGAIKKHAQLLKVAQQLSTCYSNLFVAQSLYTVGHSCVLLFGSVHVDSKIEVAMNQGTMLMTSYMQLLVYCYYGELLTSKFSHLLFDSYNNAWYDCDLEIKKATCKFALMCYRQVSLRGFGNVHPSLSNWLHSLQESVSYFLFLKTISGDK